MSVRKSLIIVALLAFAGLSAHGQAAKSPYSVFGVGDMWDPAMANAQGMAGVGVSNPQFWYLNSLNPALLVFNRLTTFHAGVLGERRTANSESQRESSYDGNMNYLMLGVPLKMHRFASYPAVWSSAVSMSPYSTVNYGFRYELPVENSPGTAVFTERGSGGINQLSWSNGFSLFRYVSIGIRVNYLFSSIENNFGKTVEIGDDQLSLLTSNTLKRYTFSDFTYTGGISLHLDSLGAKRYRFNVGAVYNRDANVRTNYFEVLQKFNQNGQQLTADTIVATKLGDTFIPGSVSVGLSFGKAETWTFAVDGRISDFTQFKPFEKRETPVGEGWKIAAGIELTPDPGAMSSYIQKMTFRTGVSFEESPFLANNNPLQDFGINFGISAPVGRFSSLDLAFRWGQRGNIELNTIEEDYFKIYFGVTFNDKWFTKRRFD
jgi:hypothetical protein